MIRGTAMNFLYVGLAGFLGAVTRIWIGRMLIDVNPEALFPYHTLLINLTGSFLLTYFLIFVESKANISTNLKIGISTGFLGSFTTFSTFSVETIYLIQIKAYETAILYIVLSFIGGISFALLGHKLAKSQLLRKSRVKLRGNE